MKNKHGGADVAFIISVCITHSPLERLTLLLSSKDKSPRNEEA